MTPFSPAAQPAVAPTAGSADIASGLAATATAEPRVRRGYMPRAKGNAWRTPAEIVSLLLFLFDGPPDMDPCSHPESLVVARTEFFGPDGSAGDGLATPWWGKVYVNPPFDALNRWAAKCVAEHREHGAEIVLLLPARTDTRYWHEHIAIADAVCFWKGRLRFVGAAASCPFPTALVYWGPRPWAFHRVFSPHGMVVTP